MYAHARIDQPDNHGMMSAFAALLIILPLFLGSCQQSTNSDDISIDPADVAKNRARLLSTIDLPFAPGPVVVVSAALQNPEGSHSGRLWLGDGGTQLYALHRSEVWAIDLSSLRPQPVSQLGAEAAELAGSDDEGALLVTQRDQGRLLIMDATARRSVEVAVGAGPGALALGLGHRIAYVVNQWEESLSLVETGLGTYLARERSVLVAAAHNGEALLLDSDGRIRQHYEGLPGSIGDLAVLPGGRQVLATYSSIEVGGDPDTLGDHELLVDEGLVLLDLQSGEMTTWPLDRSAQPSQAAAERLARPTGLAIVDDGQRALVALPGWQGLGVIDLSEQSNSRGQLLDFIGTSLAPRYLTAATDDKVSDWVYVLDSATGALAAIDREGRQVWSEQLQ